VKPADVFDRDEEWRALTEFAGPGPGARLGVVTGRRRVGKSFLLRRLAAGGVYHQAIAEERRPALDRVGALVAERAGLPDGSVHPVDWVSAFDALGSMPAPVDVPLVVVDELPYLLEHSPELLSVIQRWYDALPPDSPVRLVLCGSSLSTMSALLTGAQPLRGRAALDLRLSPFDYRVMRDHWAIDSPAVAFDVHAAVGGSPGYRALSLGAVPQHAADFPEWLGATLLNPAHALYREDDYLLREEPRISDRALYQSLLASIAQGDTTPTAIGRRLGRDRTSLAALLRVLVDAGFVERGADIGNQRAVTYTVADPILRFSRLLIAPYRPLLDEGRWRAVWDVSGPTWSSQVRGPHAETVFAEWVRRYASLDTIGGLPVRLGRFTLADERNRSRLELDLAGERADGTYSFLAEVKAGGALVGIEQLERLQRARELLGARGRDAKLVIAALGGFTAELVHAGTRPDVELVDLDRLYGGD